jgi:hypothetical protein
MRGLGRTRTTDQLDFSAPYADDAAIWSSAGWAEQRVVTRWALSAMMNQSNTKLGGGGSRDTLVPSYLKAVLRGAIARAGALWDFRSSPGGPPSGG